MIATVSEKHSGSRQLVMDPSIEQPSYYGVTLQGQKDIRLVTILPNDEDGISCKLEVVSLDEKPSYLALSYVWGDETNTQEITCNGNPFPITKNLAAAMRKLQHKYPEATFWIDSLCINQSDLKERAEQVRMMRDIYSSAKNVIIFLGEESEGLSTGMDLFDRMYQMAELDEGNKLPLDVRSRLPDPYSESWFRLHDFFNRPWFTRIWVLQEVIASSGDPEVICGQFTLRWSAVVKVALFMRINSLHLSTGGGSHSYNAILMQTCKDYPRPLFFLLANTRFFQATDPRDKLFALYGACTPMEKDMLASPYFEISYEKSIKDVYRDATAGFMVHFNTLELMGEAWNEESCSIPGLPSWIPNWNALPESRRPSMTNGTYLDAGYNASGGVCAMIHFPDNKDVIRVAGKPYAVISWVAEPLKDEEIRLLPHLRKPKGLERLWCEVSKRLGDNRETADAFWRTMIGNLNRDHKPLDWAYYIHFLRFWHDSKCADAAALKYTDPNHPYDPRLLTENEARTFFLKDQEALDCVKAWSIDHIDAYRRFCEKVASSLLPCTGSVEFRQQLVENGVESLNLSDSDSHCKHCVRLSFPDLIWDSKNVLNQPCPAQPFRDNDPFIADYFHYIENSDSWFLADGNHFYYTRLKDSFRGNALFITEDGSLGLGPSNAVPGDEVVILAGSRVPFILRKGSKRGFGFDQTIGAFRSLRDYKVIGDCYVHGIMGGEAVKEFNWEKDYDVYDLV